MRLLEHGTLRQGPNPQSRLAQLLAPQSANSWGPWFRQHVATRLISLGDYTARTEVRDRAGEPELCQELVRVLAESR